MGNTCKPMAVSFQCMTKFTKKKKKERGWDGWMASPTGWTCVWAGSRSWWWTGKPSMLQSTGSQKVRHDWVTELNCASQHVTGDSLVAQTIRNPPAMQQTRLWIPDLEDPLEKGKATHSSILVWIIPQRSLVDHNPWGHKELDTTEQLTLHLKIH